ncbi:endonuclease/exonuclease/phosphatase family protein [Mucilaginibacter terrae]|uniref:Endonuclease/exonuclease/phosphatase family metal-dependent hydrolase n=1 Tax=Mucilaginibacter terrae TaxID=1955052 RepID=A0ABU3GU39_9SPHI|nr:endonuclease/exonuclease/phosphatase family protein [Mucilaginibacter terrae]MDT3403289.1 endonuclease/exonuclease/phosphatase family metal-dependent hydrolase [Mucilaginibacter terrae]
MRANKQKRLNFFDRIFLWLSVLLGLALLISYLAPVTDPRTFWPIAFLGLAYVPLLAANVVMLVYWVFRVSKYIFIPILSIALGWNILNNNLGLRLPASTSLAPGLNMVRVMTYNAHNFKPYGDKNDPATKQQMLQLIATESPDIIGIDEFYSRKRGEYALKDSMKKIMHSGEYYFEPFSFDTGSEAMGMAIFSKHPIINKGNIILSTETGSSNQCIYVDVKKDTVTYRYYNVHLQSIRFDPVDYDYLSKVSDRGKPDIKSSRRIGGKLKRAFIKRSEQVFKIKAHAAKCPYPYIIAGDFNDTPASYAVAQMSKGIKNTFREKGSGFARTYNGSFPNFQIDYIMASNGFNVASYHIIKKKLSDHYPVCSTLLLK